MYKPLTSGENRKGSRQRLKGAAYFKTMLAAAALAFYRVPP
jgi:hypothetical protein